MHIFLYSGFRKRPNSTKIPDSSVTYKDLEGYLREPCSVVTPVFNIKRPILDFVPNVYNYAYIPNMNRYFFIRDWIWNDGLWECHCEEDVLASWRSSIGNTEAYIERCSHNFNQQSSVPEYDGSIIDKTYPVKTDFQTEQWSITSPFSGVTVDNGCFVLGVFGGSATNAGTAVDYWALTPAQMARVSSYLLSDPYFENAGFTNLTQPITIGLAKSLVNPIQYITSCMWFPFSATSIASGSATTIKIGPYNLDASQGPQGYHLGASATAHYTIDVTVPVHPQAATRGDYLRYNPFSRYSLLFPPFGTMPIDIAYYAPNDVLEIDIVIDCITGKARMCLRFKSSDSSSLIRKYFYETSSQFGVPIQLAQVANDAMRAVTSVINATTTAIAGAMDVMGATQGGIAGLSGAVHETGLHLNSIANAVESMFPQLITQGVTGSFSAFSSYNSVYPALTARFGIVVDENREEWGRPLCQIRYINTFAGFVKCGDIHVDFGCLAEENRMIENFLMSGFFYE